MTTKNIKKAINVKNVCTTKFQRFFGRDGLGLGLNIFITIKALWYMYVICQIKKTDYNDNFNLFYTSNKFITIKLRFYCTSIR